MAGAIQRIAMYQKIQALLKEKSITDIALELQVSRPTIYKYLSMDEEGFLAFNHQHRKKAPVLSPFEEEFRKRLQEYPHLSAASFEDYLKEHHPQVKASPKTVYNFIEKLRKKYQIPKSAKPAREYGPVEELAYGKQGQVDFGQRKMKDS